MKFAVLCGLFVLIVAREVNAYIDPGTGGVVFSYLSYLLAGIITALGLLLWPFKKIISKYFKKNGSQEKTRP